MAYLCRIPPDDGIWFNLLFTMTLDQALPQTIVFRQCKLLFPQRF